MNDNELRRQLRPFNVPPASDAARERARHGALIAFQQGSSAPVEKISTRGFIWLWPAAATLVVVVALALICLPKHHNDSENLANDRQMLRQVEDLFPDQVNAVVEDHGKVDLSISQTPVVGSDQPVLLVFQRGHDTIRVLSYSGHRLCVMLGQTENCFEILATPNGGVILEGKDQAWLATERTQISGYSLRAQTLEASL